MTIYIAAQFQWDNKISFTLLEMKFQELLYKGLFSRQEHGTGRTFSAGFSLNDGLCERPLFSNEC